MKTQINQRSIQMYNSMQKKNQEEDYLSLMELISIYQNQLKKSHHKFVKIVKNKVRKKNL